MAVTPYESTGKSKKEQVAEMFNNIASKYDLLNHVLSFGTDRLWRRKAINILKEYAPKTILDIATGTGDFAIAASKLNPEKITGIDISKEMLEVGKEKIKEKGLSHIIEMMIRDSEKMDFNTASYDAATVAFGVRNFENLDNGLKEIARVLKKGAPLVVLEFSKPSRFPFKQFYHFYSYSLLPFIGRLVSKDKSAYTYLPKSIAEFPDGKAFLNKLENAGFCETKQFTLTFGVASIYIGHKK